MKAAKLEKSDAKSQCARIWRDLNLGKHISPIDALQYYGCFRLAARVYDLKRKYGENSIATIQTQPYAIYALGDIS